MNNYNNFTNRFIEYFLSFNVEINSKKKCNTYFILMDFLLFIANIYVLNINNRFFLIIVYISNIFFSYYLFKKYRLSLFYKHIILFKQRLITFFTILKIAVELNLFFLAFVTGGIYVLFFIFSMLPFISISRDFVLKNKEIIKKIDTAYFNNYDLYKVGFLKIDLIFWLLILTDIFNIEISFYIFNFIIVILFFYNYKFVFKVKNI